MGYGPYSPPAFTAAEICPRLRLLTKPGLLAKIC